MVEPPDLSQRPFALTLRRAMRVPPPALFRAWTVQLDRWFAHPGTLRLRLEVDEPYFFEARFDGQRHAHHGRILALEPDRLLSLTWVTGPTGTQGCETILTLALGPTAAGSELTLAHAGFPDAATRDGHERAWPEGLDLLEATFGAVG